MVAPIGFPARDGSPARYSRYDQDIHDQQAYYGIPEAFIRAVIKVESDYDPRVVSSVGAQGLMQLMPRDGPPDGRHRSLRRAPGHHGRGALPAAVGAAASAARPPADERGPAAAAAPTDRDLVCSDAEIIKVIAGYHAGPGAVEKYGGMPPYETTRACT